MSRAGGWPVNRNAAESTATTARAPFGGGHPGGVRLLGTNPSHFLPAMMLPENVTDPMGV